MDPSCLAKAKDPDLAGSYIAMERAAKIARDVAIQTGTGIVVMRGDEIVFLSAQELIEAKKKESV